MKKHSLYKWFRRVAMLSGIPALTMMFACMKKYGAPNDVIWGAVLDQEINFSLRAFVYQAPLTPMSYLPLSTPISRSSSDVGMNSNLY